MHIHRSPFPTHLADVTLDWVAAALGIDPMAVDSFRMDIPQQRRGYGSEIGHIKLESSDLSLPSRLVVKVPPEHPPARNMVRELGGFQREADFYRFLAPCTEIRTPVVYAIESDRNSGDGILLMKDCSGMMSFSFSDDPPSLEQLRHITDAAAGFHANWWGRTDELSQFDAVVLPDSYTWDAWAQGVQTDWLEWLRSSLRSYAPEPALPVCERLAREFYWLQVVAWPTRNLTLTHMDFHARNIFYDTGHATDPVVVFDWDGCHLGCGAHDLAYLLAMLPTAWRRRHEQSLLREYHQALLAKGVVDYTMDELYQDYRFGCLFNTYVLPVMLSLELTGAQGVEFSAVTTRILQTMLDHDAHRLLDELHSN